MRLKSIDLSVYLSFHPLQLTSLELQYVSPKLLMCRDLELAVPGTYDPNQPIIRIQSIAPSLQVITSKQRPRKLTIMGETERGYRLVLYARGNQRRLEGISAECTAP